MKKMTNKNVALACVGAAFVLALGASMAYFTDYAVTSAEGTAGTVAIALDNKINLLNEDGMDILNPGDQRDAGFNVTNMGNKSIDVRETVILEIETPNTNLFFTGDAESQSEFDLYLRSDVELVEGEGYKPLAGAKPLAVKEVEGKKITYTLPEYSLNGNSDEYDEVETIEGVDTFAKENDYVLVFKGEAGNEWQDVRTKITVFVEAKQHENTGAGWELIEEETVVFNGNGKSMVPSEVIITPTGAEGAAPN